MGAGLRERFFEATEREINRKRPFICIIEPIYINRLIEHLSCSVASPEEPVGNDGDSANHLLAVCIFKHSENQGLEN